MNLLIVDDERYIIDDMMASVDWKSLDIHTVSTAMNVRQAKKVLEEENIQIMLCDIEMPQASGLDLLAWMRERNIDCETVFLTCHAEFQYAQKAIRLGVSEYLLKPIDYAALEQVIVKLEGKITAARQQNESAQYGEYWHQHQPLLAERFWQDIINRNITPDKHVIRDAASRRNIPFSEALLIRPVLVKIQKWPVNITLEDEIIFEYGIKNIADEAFINGGKNGIALRLAHNSLLILIPGEQKEGAGAKLLQKEIQRFIGGCRAYCACDLSCYLGNQIYAESLADTVDQLLALDRDNVTHANQVSLQETLPVITTEIDGKRIAGLAVYVERNQEEALMEHVRSYLQNLASSTGLDSKRLYHFQQDFVQMLYAEAGKKGILSHQLLNDDTSLELSRNATQSVEAVLRWASHISHKIVSYAKETQKAQSVVNNAEKYIKEHLSDDLKREEVAGYVYLNPDYLDRMFKKENGISIAKFITREKVEYAKYKLAGTNESISSIAAQVGYNNISNFSMMFKRLVGMKPNEYRKEFRK